MLAFGKLNHIIFKNIACEQLKYRLEKTKAYFQRKTIRLSKRINWFRRRLARKYKRRNKPANAATLIKRILALPVKLQITVLPEIQLKVSHYCSNFNIKNIQKLFFVKVSTLKQTFDLLKFYVFINILFYSLDRRKSYATISLNFQE